MTELWNAYRWDGRLTDTVLRRGEPIPEGRYHLACEVLVRQVVGSAYILGITIIGCGLLFK